MTFLTWLAQGLIAVAALGLSLFFFGFVFLILEMQFRGLPARGESSDGETLPPARRE